MKKFIYIIFALTLMAGCTPDPAACILVQNNGPVMLGSSVQFYNCSFDAETYHWDFADGTTSTEKDPLHTFNTPGTFLVKLTAKSKNGKKENLSAKTITVLDSTIASFIGTYDTTQDCDNMGLSNYFMAIAQDFGGQLMIQNMGGFALNPTVHIVGNTITIPNQTADGFQISGTGTLNGNLLSISYTISNISFFDSCTLTAIKQ